MKSILFVLIIVGIYFMTFGKKEPQMSDVNPTTLSETTNNKSMDSLSNTYKTRVEAQNIANTINPSNSYLGSRLDARGSAKGAVDTSNQRTEAQNKAIDNLIK